MPNIALLIFLLFLTNASLQGQQSQVRFSSINASANGEIAFSFIHITDVHIGDGHPDGDFGTEGFWDDTLANEKGTAIMALNNAVRWINDHSEQLGIHFVLLSGDITDSAEKSEFLRAKSILDKLSIPYIPLIGNHDVWSYTRNVEDNRPRGDSMINTIFEDNFTELQSFFDVWDDGQRLSRTWNPEGETYQYLQNFSFQYKGYTFVMADFNPRYHVRDEPGAPGIGPEAQIMNFQNGTWNWFKETIKSVAGQNNEHVIISSHHPPIKDFFGPQYAFDFNELQKIKSFLFDYRNDVSHWLGGHIHRLNEGNLNSIDAIYKICEVWETDANKEWDFGTFRLVDVYELPVITGVDEGLNLSVAVYPNPAQEFIKISWNKITASDIKLSIIDGCGKIIDQFSPSNVGNNFRLDLSDYSIGHYFIKIETPGATDFSSFMRF